jgi:hypothetical protein
MTFTSPCCRKPEDNVTHAPARLPRSRPSISYNGPTQLARFTLGMRSLAFRPLTRLPHSSLRLPVSASRTMSKRARSPSPVAGGAAGLKEKKSRTTAAQVVHRKVATAEAAAAVDTKPPYFQLRDAAKSLAAPDQPGQAIVFWQRFQDMRIDDNRALSQASQHAQQLGLPLVVLFVISPDDYEAHDCSPRRVDFVLRNLAVLKVGHFALYIRVANVWTRMDTQSCTFPFMSSPTDPARRYQRLS